MMVLKGFLMMTPKQFKKSSLMMALKAFCSDGTKKVP